MMDSMMSKIILPPDADLLLLLKVCFLMTLVFYIPFFAMTIGSLISAVGFDLLSESEECHRREVAREIMTRLFPARHYGILYGVVPILTIFVVYSQSLYAADIHVYSAFLWSAATAFAGYLFFYKYRSSLVLSHFLHGLGKSCEKLPHEVAQTFHCYEKKSRLGRFLGGGLGILFLLWSSYLLIGAMDTVLHSHRWSMMTTSWLFLISGSFWFKYLLFLALSMAFAAAGMLLFMLKRFDSLSDEAYQSAKTYSSFTGLYACLCIPVFSLFYCALLPAEALSGRVVMYFLFALLFCLVATARFRTAAYTASRRGGSYTAFITLVVITLFISISDNVARENATREHTNKVLSGEITGPHQQAGGHH